MGTLEPGGIAPLNPRLLAGILSGWLGRPFGQIIYSTENSEEPRAISLPVAVQSPEGYGTITPIQLNP